jgi:hypothetical protein
MPDISEGMDGNTAFSTQGFAYFVASTPRFALPRVSAGFPGD